MVLTTNESVLDAAQIAALADGRSVTDPGGGRRTILWQDAAGSAAGVLELEAGERIGEHTHTDHAHHVWVVDGQVDVLGRELGAGSYWYVPPGRPHTLTASGGPCRLFYLYQAA